MIESTLIQLAISLLVLALLIAYLLVKIPKSYKLKLLLIPVVFILALYMGTTIPGLLGYAYPGRPKGEFTYVSHQIEQGDKVELLAKINGNMRLYSFKGDPDTDAQLANAQALTARGETVTGKFKNPDKFGFPGLYQSPSPLEIKSPHNYGMLPPKNPQQTQSN